MLSITREIITITNTPKYWLSWRVLPILWLFYVGNTLACTFSSPTVTLPPNSSFNVNTLTESGSGTIAMLCTGTGVSLLASPVLNATVASTTNTLRLKNSAGDFIPYTIYSDAGYNNAIAIGSVINYSSNSSLLTVTLFQISANLPIYIRTGSNNAININVSAGTYTDVINLNWNYNLCATSIFSLCLGGPFSGTATSTVTVTLTVSNDCVINSAPNVNFGSYALIAQFAPVNQNISATCTKNATFTTYITNGNNFVAPWPRMKLTSGTDYLQYQLYQGAGIIPWNVTNKRASTATGTQQLIPYNAVINTQQAQKTVGTYQDNVSVVLEY